MQPLVKPVQYVEYTIQIPGVEGAIFLKLPAGSMPPRVVVSETVAAESPVVPMMQVPERISAKLPTPVKINGQPRTVPACVAAVLKLIADGADAVELRPETLAKFRLAVPEIVLVRDAARKVRSNRAWYLVG